MYAVAGVSGQTGSIAAEELIRRGKKVRAIVRSAAKGERWKGKGAEVAIADVDDADSLGRALTGCEGAYLLIPPDMGSTDPIGRAQRLGDTYARAAKASGIRHVVFLSSMGAQHSSGTGPIRGVHEVEKRLHGAGLGLTFLRPTYFFENWTSSLDPAVSDGVFPSFIPADHRFPQIATKDIGVAAADALLNPSQGRSIVELAGPQDYTPREMAAVVGSIIGKDVQVSVGPLEAVVPAFTSFGASPQVAELFREMYEGLIDGRIEWDGEGERKRGTTTPEEVFRPMLTAGRK